MHSADNLLTTPLDPVADLLACQHAIRSAGWWHKAGLAERWPLATNEVAEMLAAAEYEATADDLEDLIRRGLLPRPGRGEEEAFEWLAVDLCHAAGLLEARRQWRPAPSCHDPKKTHEELLLEAARADGSLGDVAGGRVKFDPRHLLELLVMCDSREGRRKIGVLLAAVLEYDHDLRM